MDVKLVCENVMRYRTFTVPKNLPTTYLFNYKGTKNAGRQHLNQQTMVVALLVVGKIQIFCHMI